MSCTPAHPPTPDQPNRKSYYEASWADSLARGNADDKHVGNSFSWVHCWQDRVPTITCAVYGTNMDFVTGLFLNDLFI